MSASSLHTDDTLILTATVTPGATPMTVDAYVAVQLPNGTHLFLQGNGSFTTAIRPIVTGFRVAPFTGEIFRYPFKGDEPPGSYAWLAAFIEQSTGKIIGEIARTPFTFSQ